MRYITTINNKKCLEWKISGTQGALMSLLYEVSAWAEETVVGNKVYYFVSKNLILKELPLYYEKTDTIYRHLKILAEKGIIEYIKQGKKDLIRLTKKGKTWNYMKDENSEKNSDLNPKKDENSEINPRKLGFESERCSDLNPTNKDTIYKKDDDRSNNKYIDYKKTLSDEIMIEIKKIIPDQPNNRIEIVLMSVFSQMLSSVKHFGKDKVIEALGYITKNDYLKTSANKNPGLFFKKFFDIENIYKIQAGTYEQYEKKEISRIKTDEEIAEEYDFDEYDKR